MENWTKLKIGRANACENSTKMTESELRKKGQNSTKLNIGQNGKFDKFENSKKLIKFDKNDRIGRNRQSSKK